MSVNSGQNEAARQVGCSETGSVALMPSQFKKFEMSYEISTRCDYVYLAVEEVIVEQIKYISTFYQQLNGLCRPSRSEAFVTFAGISFAIASRRMYGRRLSRLS